MDTSRMFVASGCCEVGSEGPSSDFIGSGATRVSIGRAKLKIVGF